MSVRFATGPTSWGVDDADSPNNPPWRQVLDEIQQSGVGALELGPVGYLPENAAALRAELAARNLEAVGSFVFDNLHDSRERGRVVEITHRACRVIAAAGGTILVIIDKPSEGRVSTAGRSDAAPRLSDPDRAEMLTTINSMAAIARQYGLSPTVHPHAGGYIEFEDEVEWIAAASDLDLCVDVGHLAYAGARPEQLLKRLASRVRHVHLKDVRADVHARVQREGLTFWEAIQAGIFCPMGQGVVDAVAVFQTLHAIGYDGFATIEQDRVPGTGRPLDDLRASLDLLRTLTRPSNR